LFFPFVSLIVALMLLACSSDEPSNGSASPVPTTSIQASQTASAIEAAQPRPTATITPTPAPAPPTATPDPSVPVASREGCPLHPDVCALAWEVDEGLWSFQRNRDDPGQRDNSLSMHDLRGVLGLLQPLAIDCTYSFGMSGDLCDGAQQTGQHRLGIWMWNEPGSDDRRGVPITDLQQRLLFWSPRPGEIGDELAGPYLRLVAIGCPTSIDALSSCREHFSFVLSSRATYPHDDAQRRFVMVLPVVWPENGAPSVRLTIPVSPTNEPVDTYATYILGGAVTGDSAIYTQEPEWLSGLPVPATGVFVPWRP
jgi:hypothetical protein